MVLLLFIVDADMPVEVLSSLEAAVASVAWVP